MIKKNKGFTLIETLIVIALLSLVLGAAYSLYFSTINTFNKAEKNWNMRSELERAGNYIVNELRHAFEVEFDPENFNPENENEHYIFISDNGNIIHRQGNEENSYIEKVIIYSKNDLNYELNFDRVNGENNELLHDTIRFDISVIDGMSVSSEVMAANIPPRNEIVGQSGNSIYYKRSPDSGKIPAAEFDTYCFIATAAYGGPMAPAITVLRSFRDNILIKIPGGKFIINKYYSISPPIAKIISKSFTLKFFVRLLLYIVIGFIFILFFPFKLFPLILLITVFHVKIIRKRSNIIIEKG